MSARILTPPETHRARVEAADDLYFALVELKRSFWDEARVRWNMADFKNFAAVQQCDRALAKARGEF